MSDGNVDMDDLDAFENSFFEKEAAAPVKEAPAIEDDEDVIENQVETPATDDPEDEDEPEGDDEPEDEDDEEEEEPAPKPKKKSAQERINELTKAKREAERREADLLRRLEALESPKEVKAEKPPLRDILPDGAPNPDAVGEDGEPLYVLGEFDPKFIRDLTRYTIGEETKAARLEAEENAARVAQEAELNIIKTEWVERLDKFEEEAPDAREAIAELTEVFVDLDEGYGEYLATTIMASEVGPQIMYYFSQNIGEAQKIVASGPAAATRMLGRLEAKFIKDEAEAPAPEPKRNKRVSAAPTPPETASRGRAGKFSVSPDTDDLDAFEREFYKKR